MLHPESVPVNIAYSKQNASVILVAYFNMLPETHFNGKIAQKAVIVRGETVLVVRDPREIGSRWELPGGRLNEGEDPKAGLAREVKEELGVECIVGEVVHLVQFWQYGDRKNALMIAYRAFIGDTATLSFAVDEVCEARWITQSDIATLDLFPEYRDTLMIYFEKQRG